MMDAAGEIFKWFCILLVSAGGVFGFIMWLGFRHEWKAERQADREHIARSGGM